MLARLVRPVRPATAEDRSGDHAPTCPRSPSRWSPPASPGSRSVLYENTVVRKGLSRGGERRRGHPAPGRHPDYAASTQAGLQPPRPLPAWMARLCPTAPASSTCCRRWSRRPWRRGIAAWSSLSSRRWAALLKSRMEERRAGDTMCSSCTVASRRRGARTMVARVPGGGERTAPRIFVLSLKAGGTGLNLTRCQPRLPLRPLVEPRGRGSGHRPGLPHRAAAQRLRPQVRLLRHPRGAHPGDAGTQAGRGQDPARRTGERLAHRAQQRRTAPKLLILDRLRGTGREANARPIRLGERWRRDQHIVASMDDRSLELALAIAAVDP